MSTPILTIANHPEPTLNGPVTVHLPTPYEQVKIDKRMAQLAQPFNYDQLPAEGRARVRMLATLEFVIDTAPEGFYRPDPKGQPLLDFSGLLEIDEDVLWAIYAAYRAYREECLKSREGITLTAHSPPRGDADLPRREDDQPRPAARIGAERAVEQ